MDWVLVLIGMFSGIVVLLLAGIPIVFSFLAVNIVGAFFVLGGDIGVTQMIRNMTSSVTNYALAPIVLFVFMGEVLLQSGVAQKAIGAIDRIFSKVPGRLSLVAVAGGTVFSSLSGSTMANTAVLGKTLLPEMRSRGYDASISMGPIMAVGGIAMLVPPSSLAVLLGSIGKISINELLIASILPAIIIAFSFFMYIVLRCWMNPAIAPAYDVERASLSERLKPIFIYVFPLFLIFVAVVGSMIGGLATPTESAALGCIATLVICMCYRALTLKKVSVSISETIKFSAVILFVISASSSFSQILAFSGATQALSQAVSNSGWDALYLLFAMLGVIIVLGFFMDQVSIMMLTLPIFMPIANVAGIEPVWFGVMLLIALELGLCTPPFGLLLFVMKGVVPDVKVTSIYRSVVPFVLIELVVLVVLIFFPEIIYVLPGYMLN